MNTAMDADLGAYPTAHTRRDTLATLVARGRAWDRLAAQVRAALQGRNVATAWARVHDLGAEVCVAGFHINGLPAERWACLSQVDAYRPLVTELESEVEGLDLEEWNAAGCPDPDAWSAVAFPPAE